MKKLGWVFAGLTVMSAWGIMAMCHVGAHRPELAVTVAKALAKGALIGIAKLIQLVV